MTIAIRLLLVIFVLLVLLLASCQDSGSEEHKIIRFENIELQDKYHHIPAAHPVFNGVYHKDQNLLYYTITLKQPQQGGLLKAHFQGPALTAQPSNPLIYMFTEVEAARIKDQYSGKVLLTGAQETELLAGNWFIHLYDRQKPNEPLRAQLIAAR